MCNLVGLYMSGGTAQHSWTELKPKTTGQRVCGGGAELGVQRAWAAQGAAAAPRLAARGAERSPHCVPAALFLLAHRQIMRFHRHKHPDAFLVHDKLAEQENGTVFRVAFMQRARLRSIRNLEQAVQVRGWCRGGCSVSSGAVEWRGAAALTTCACPTACLELQECKLWVPPADTPFK